MGRFIQADSLIPDAMNSQAFDRYAYVLNNPLKYTDPSGNTVKPPEEDLNKKCGPDMYDCPEERINDPDPTQSLVGLTEDGLRLMIFAINGGYSPDEVIQMGISGEIASWYTDKSKVSFFTEAMAVRYQWYKINFCGGVNSQICRINFWTIYSQTVMDSIVNGYWNNPTKAGIDYKPPWTV